MKHRKKGKKLNRSNKGRKALFKNLLTSFFLHEKIKTTQAKAKAIQGKIDRLINKAKKDDLVSRRFIFSYLDKKESAQNLIDNIAPRFKKRTSGYTRLLKLGTRQGDQAQMALLQLVEPLGKENKKEKDEK